MKVYHSSVGICIARALSTITAPTLIKGVKEVDSDQIQVDLPLVKGSNAFQSEDNRMLLTSTDEKITYFQIQSTLTTDNKKLCLQPDSGKNLIIMSCNGKKRSQQWRADKESRIHNKRNDDKCLRQIRGEISYTWCDDIYVEGSSFVSLNIFDNTFTVGDKVMTVLNGLNGESVELVENQNIEDLGQKWTIDYGTLPKLHFIGNPCRDYGNNGVCQECHGDCDDDDDCEGSLRCAQRTAKHGRENVPGCEWGPYSDFYRFQANDYCFQPVKVEGEVNYIGKCRQSYQCNLCEGECSCDSDCTGNLKCYHRFGLEHVPGCKSHGGPHDMYGKNICYDPNNLPQINDSGNLYQGSPKIVLTECQGDCTEDTDCKGHLRCAQRQPGATVPGCTFKGTDLISGDKNFCFEPENFPRPAGTLIYVGECNPSTYKCQRCQGNCKSDSDCASGLTCMPRSAFEEVPGCYGEGDNLDMQGQNVCYDSSSNPILRQCNVYHNKHYDTYYSYNKNYNGYYGYKMKNYGNKKKYKRGSYPECVGNCEKDKDCARSLRCAKREGFEDVPGCSWEHPNDSLNELNFCFKPVISLGNRISYIGECGKKNPCDRCKGNCFIDADCVGDLKCKERIGFEPVQGCIDEGGIYDMYAKNICYDGSTESPTRTPSSSPTSVPSLIPTSSLSSDSSKSPSVTPSLSRSSQSPVSLRRRLSLRNPKF